MKRRWFIRGVLIALLLLCAVGWVASYTGKPAATYVTQEQFYWVEPMGGSLCAGWTSESLGQDGLPGFDFQAGSANEYNDDYVNTYPHLLGFCGGVQTYRWGSAGVVGVPFWYMTLLFGAVAFWGWGRTPAIKSAKAFPVEIKAVK